MIAQHDAAIQAIKIRYSEAAKVEGANAETLANEEAKELEALDADFYSRKNILEGLKKGAVISEIDYRNLPEEYEELVTVKMGAQAIRELLEEIDLDAMIEDLSAQAEDAKGQKERKLIKRIKLLEGMKNSNIKPVDLVLTVIPVIPPDLRPMISLPGGRFATSDLNDLYRRVFKRNYPLKKLQCARTNYSQRNAYAPRSR